MIGGRIIAWAARDAYRRGEEAAESRHRAVLVGIANLHVPLPGEDQCRTCWPRKHPCATHQLATARSDR